MNDTLDRFPLLFANDKKGGDKESYIEMETKVKAIKSKKVKRIIKIEVKINWMINGKK